MNLDKIGFLLFSLFFFFFFSFSKVRNNMGYWVERSVRPENII